MAACRDTLRGAQGSLEAPTGNATHGRSCAGHHRKAVLAPMGVARTGRFGVSDARERFLELLKQAVHRSLTGQDVLL